jgi:hypothetical protein
MRTRWNVTMMRSSELNDASQVWLPFTRNRRITPR